MPRPVPMSRSTRPQVAVQVARGGGPGRPEGPGGAVSSRGRHRTPDTGQLPAPGRDADEAPRAAIVPAMPSAPSRHTTLTRRESPDRAPAPGPASAEPASPAPAAAPASAAPASRSPIHSAPPAAAAGAPAPRSSTPPASVRSPSAPTPSPPAVHDPADDEAVTELVAGPSRRGRAGMPDGPGTGPVPGLVGLVLGLLALLGAVVAAAAPGVALPVVGAVGTSPLAPAGVLATALLATACAGLGAGRHRTGRAAAVTGLVVGLAAVAASVVPLLAL